MRSSRDIHTYNSIRFTYPVTSLNHGRESRSKVTKDLFRAVSSCEPTRGTNLKQNALTAKILHFPRSVHGVVPNQGNKPLQNVDDGYVRILDDASLPSSQT